VHYIFSDLNREWADYSFGNKIYACALVETLCLNYVKNLCFLDTDIICNAPPYDLILGNSHDIALCPVDKKGVGLKSDEVLNAYWQAVFDLYKIDLPPSWTVNTTYENEAILPYFNAGMITVNPTKQLFKNWETGLKQIKIYKYQQIFSQEQQHNLDQALLAALILKKVPQKRTKVLPPAYNYPLHLHKELPQVNKLEQLRDGIFFHYHSIFYDKKCLYSLPFSEEQKDWLAPRLPIKLSIGRRMKRIGARIIEKIYQNFNSRF
jgi:hypothetical protein